MEIQKVVLGELQVNCYIVFNEQKEAVIIDPGSEPEQVMQIVNDKRLKVKGILLTHSHFDHIGATDAIVRYTDARVYAHEQEASDMLDSGKNLSDYFYFKKVFATVHNFVSQGEVLEFGNDLVFKCIELPGHSDHSMCYYYEAGNSLFAGDTLFNDAIGRTDMYSGETTDLARNIVKRLFYLPVQTVVYPGHGLKTTLGKEKKDNYHLKGYFWNE